MKGYDVVTSDDRKFGTVVGDEGDFLVVEHGTLRKARRALPKAFAHPVDADRVVRVTVSKELIAASPKVDGRLDEQSVARHYGLAAGYEQPDTEGRGDVLPDDPAEGSVVEGQRHGVEPQDKRRAEMREGRRDSSAPAVHERMPNVNDPGGVGANYR